MDIQVATIPELMDELASRNAASTLILAVVAHESNEPIERSMGTFYYRTKGHPLALRGLSDWVDGDIRERTDSQMPKMDQDDEDEDGDAWKNARG